MRGRTGLSPGEPYPGREVSRRTGLCKAGLGGRVTSVCLGSDWVTPLRTSPRCGCLRPTLLCQLRLDGLTVFRCACVMAHWERYLSRHNQTKSRLCRQCFFPPWNSTWLVLVVICLSYSLVWWSVISSGTLPAMDQACSASSAPSAPLPGTFWASHWTWGLIDYDLMHDIPDVMGLRALRPSAAIVKVMSIPDSRCVRVVTPDDHVNIGFHEVLFHDLEDEDLPFVALSELGCLRLVWPKTLFTFMSRYQFDLEQMHKDCRERFGSTQLGSWVLIVVNISSRIWASTLHCIIWS